MCGIAGLIGFRGDLKDNIGKMNHRMLHRGLIAIIEVRAFSTHISFDQRKR